ncbi:hypothetical protein FBU30_003191 [Linnemannia zychae]|nr:hypothetical protein FBU30_003191 [Linnemannia zychae]
MQHYHHNQSQPKLPPVLPPPGSVPESGTGSGFVSGIEAAAASALSLANNIAFRPMTAQPAKCSKLKIRIFFDSTIFQAGGTLFGRMEVTATSSRSLKLGEIAIELAAYEVQVFYHGKDETILKSKEAFVVEAWDGYNPEYKLPIRATNSTKLFWGGNGALELEAMLAQRLHSAGGNLTVEVKVKNNTSRKVQGIRIGVAHRLEMVSDKEKAERNPGLKIETVSVSEVIGTQEFKSSSYLFDTGEDRTMTVNMIVPGNARTIRGTALFEVTCFVVVSMLLGAFSGELSVEIPVKICHPASLTPAPLPKQDENHLPHQYNIVDDGFDLDGDMPTRSNRRVGSNASLAAPASNGHIQSGSDGHDYNDDAARIGRQGEWNGDDRGLSPANSITSIKSILSSPKTKLSKLADKIQRSTSPTNSGHITHEHRKDADNFGVSPPNRRMAKSPPLGPAVPIAYVPAVERVRYTPFQPPPTTKAKEFLKAAAQYQQEMSGVLAGLGDNVEFDLDDKTMANAIHQWMSTKESEGRYQNQVPIRAPTATKLTSPIQIPASPNRRRHPIEPINTQIGSFTSQISPSGGAPPQSYYSPASPEPSSPTAAAFSNQTTSRFIHHAHRQPAAPQTEAFGSAVEDCMTDPPLFARPLPLPSPPPTGSPKRPGLPNPPLQERPISPSSISIPVQSPESLALAREAYERVKRAGSPVPDPLLNAATPQSNAQRPEFDSSSRNTSSIEPSSNIKVPVPKNSAIGAQHPTSPSGLSHLLNNSAPQQLTHHQKHGQDGHPIDNPLPPTCSSPELRHIPLNRPLPVPGPKPPHLNQTHGQTSVPARGPSGPGSNPNVLNREVEKQSRPEPAPRSSTLAPAAPSTATATTTSSGHLHGPQPVPDEGVTRSGHLYTPKPTPTLTARPPAPVTVATVRAPIPATSARVGPHSISPTNKTPITTGGSSVATSTKAMSGHIKKPISTISTGAAVPGKYDPSSGSGYVYPKATRKPVGGVKPTVAAKPKNLTAQLVSSQRPSPDSTTSHPMDAAVHREFDQRLRKSHQETAPRDRSLDNDKVLAPTVSTRAPQMVPIALASQGDMERGVSPRGERRTQVTLGFHSPEEPILEEESIKKEGDRRGPTEVPRSNINDDPRNRVRGQSNNNSSLQDTDQYHQHQIEQVSNSPHNSNENITGNKALEDSEVSHETSSEIRAQAIAAANSFRAKGSNSGGYVVNTGKLREVIRNTDNVSNPSGGSGHLIQALADGAKSAASAAASGLGWVQQSPPSKPAPIAALRPATQQLQPQQHHNYRQRHTDMSPPRSSSPPNRGHPTRPLHHNQQFPPKSQQADRTPPRRSHHRHQDPVDQAHDLTMKDINFQTLTSDGYAVEQVAYDPLPEITVASTNVASSILAAAPTTATTTIPVTYSQKHRDDNQQQQQQQTKSQHLTRVTQKAVAIEVQQQYGQSQSQPGSKLIDMPSRHDPLPPKSVAMTVEALPDSAVSSSSTTSASEVSPPRLDKTLPKIQDQPISRSQYLEQQQRQHQDISSHRAEDVLHESRSLSAKATELANPATTVSATSVLVSPSGLSSIPAQSKTDTAKNAAAQIQAQAQQRARYYYGRAAETSGATSGAAAIANGPATSVTAAIFSSGGGAKAINPKLQEYIQKYNLAANTRS